MFGFLMKPIDKHLFGKYNQGIHTEQKFGTFIRTNRETGSIKEKGELKMKERTRNYQVNGARRSSSKRRRKVYLNKLFLCAAAVLLAFGIGIFGIGQLADAHEEPARNNDSCYKSIEIKTGDTLWEIAEEYRTADYDSVYDYINELKAINGLMSDDIQAGQYLTVVYNGL